MAGQSMPTSKEQARETGDSGPSRSEQVHVFWEIREESAVGLAVLFGCVVGRDHVWLPA